MLLPELKQKKRQIKAKKKKKTTAKTRITANVSFKPKGIYFKKEGFP